MFNWLRAAGAWGSILVVLALIITLLKQIIGFIGFITVIIKVGIVLLFIAVLAGVCFLILKSWKTRKHHGDE